MLWASSIRWALLEMASGLQCERLEKKKLVQGFAVYLLALCLHFAALCPTVRSLAGGAASGLLRRPGSGGLRLWPGQ